MEYLTKNGMSNVFNLGSGIGYTVKEIIEAVEAITGTHIPVQIEAKRAGESTMVVANTLKFRSATKWEPQYTDIADIIKNAWKWYSEYDNE
jgi:UDP-glucose 4-epimerase